MTSVASKAAGARQPRVHPPITISVTLTDNDRTMVQAFDAWNKDFPTRSPKRDQIERGYGAYRFPMTERVYAITDKSGRTPVKKDMTGPHTFARLVAIGVIEHSRNGHCWLTDAGQYALNRVLLQR